MPYAILTACAVLAIYVLAKPFHRKPRNDGASEVAHGDWPHVPKDRSRGLLPPVHGDRLTEKGARDHAS